MIRIIDAKGAIAWLNELRSIETDFDMVRQYDDLTDVIIDLENDRDNFEDQVEIAEARAEDAESETEDVRYDLEKAEDKIAELEDTIKDLQDE